MTKINISTATTTQLNYLVLVCEMGPVSLTRTDARMDSPAAYIIEWSSKWENGGWEYLGNLNYTTDWSLMGPIIDRIDGVLLKRWVRSNREGKCQVEIHNNDGDWIAFGPTLGVAAARCYVASKLGEEVEIPEELI